MKKEFAQPYKSGGSLKVSKKGVAALWGDCMAFLADHLRGSE